MNEITLSVAR